MWDTLGIWLCTDVTLTLGIIVSIIAGLAHIAWFLLWVIVTQESCIARHKPVFWDAFSNLILSVIGMGTFTVWAIDTTVRSPRVCSVLTCFFIGLLVLVVIRALLSAYVRFVCFPVEIEEEEDEI
jgi:hydrogenase-4 membrane subunit HyfE